MKARYRMNGVAALFATTALLPAALTAQDRFEAQLDAATRAVVQSVLSGAVRDSLPVSVLRSKVLEGVAKGVRPAQIAEVVGAMAQELRDTRAALRAAVPGSTILSEEIVAAATARRQGVPLEELQSLWGARREGRSLEVPLTVLGELVRRGVPAGEAAALMSHVVRSGVSAEIASQIPGKLDAPMSAGARPGVALSEALRALHIPEPPGGRPPQGGGRSPGGGGGGAGGAGPPDGTGSQGRGPIG